MSRALTAYIMKVIIKKIIISEKNCLKRYYINICSDALFVNKCQHPDLTLLLLSEYLNVKYFFKKLQRVLY